MAKDNSGLTGATNHVGELFTGRGQEVYDGLVVTDAAVIPTALGANPLATIAALAERSVEAYAERKKLSIDMEANDILNLYGTPGYGPERPRPRRKQPRADAREEKHSLDRVESTIRTAAAVDASGFGFTEIMSGFIHHDENMTGDETDTYRLAYRTARSLCESARFFLSMHAYNTREMVHEHGHSGMLTGTFACPTIPGSPFMVQRGSFNLFVVDEQAPGTKKLTYDFDMTALDGHKLHLHGYKVVDSSVALSPLQFWRSASTLYVTITEHRPGMCRAARMPEWRTAKVLAKGIMHIQPTDFLSQLMTLTPTGSNVLQKLYSAASFMSFFTRKSLSLFLAPLMPLQYPSQTYHGFVNATRPDQSVAIYASDGICSRMHIWEPTHVPARDADVDADDPVRNLFMIPGASVDHHIFAMPTIPFNAVNYFTRAGYRVFVSVHRIGQLMVAANDWTTYDARLDIKACLDYIRKAYSTVPVYTIAHCMGSVALSCGLLEGTIPARWIRGITASQVFMNPIWAPVNLAKAMAGPLPVDSLYRHAAGNWFSCTTSPDDGLVQRLINQTLRLYPQARREMCSSAACHRISLVFGRCWNHRNLNEATHRQIDRFFGGVNMTLLHLLMRMGVDGHVMRNGPLYERLTTDENVQRLRGIPILLFVGRDNAVLSPESTERTYERLCDVFGTRGDGTDYKRRVVPGYGHLDPWIGRNAWKDVYPFVREEVDLVTRGEDYRFVEPEDEFLTMVEQS